jgi:predicted Na+-dependent transporter
MREALVVFLLGLVIVETETKYKTGRSELCLYLSELCFYLMMLLISDEWLLFAAIKLSPWLRFGMIAVCCLFATIPGAVVPGTGRYNVE